MRRELSLTLQDLGIVEPASVWLLSATGIMLAIFDIDGTICDTQAVEGRCYVEAVERVTGIRISSSDWTRFVEPTSSGMVLELLKDDPEAALKGEQVKEHYVEMLKEERPRHPMDFSPLPGAVEFVQMLSESDFCSVAIATGGFDTEAEFKLQCCGLSLHDFPHATSSDTPTRRAILPLAAKRAGFGNESAVYFGDAPWDVTVSAELGIPMIGIGRRIDQLRGLGVTTLFRDFSEPAAIVDVLKKFVDGQPNLQG